MTAGRRRTDAEIAKIDRRKAAAKAAAADPKAVITKIKAAVKDHIACYQKNLAQAKLDLGAAAVRFAHFSDDPSVREQRRRMTVKYRYLLHAEQVVTDMAHIVESVIRGDLLPDEQGGR